MRAYRVSAELPVKPGVRDQAKTVQRFAGTQADARYARDTILNDNPDLKKKAVDIEEVEIPTAKAELIEFINELVSPAT